MLAEEPEGEIVRKATTSKQNLEIDRQILSNIRRYENTGRQTISKRIQELDREWDIERVLDINMSALAICGIISSLLINRYSIILPLILLLFYIWHAIQGWCPPIPILRYFKVRSRAEIDREKYALKALRGDFKPLENKNGDVSKWAFDCVSRI